MAVDTYYIRPVDTDFESLCSLAYLTFFPLFAFLTHGFFDSHSSIENISDEASVKQKMDQFKGQISCLLTGLCWISPPIS